jgi:small multidrug resistance family-3 protein
MATPFAFVFAAIAEIAGCFAFWAVVRNGASPLWLVPGGLSLLAFGLVLTQVDSVAAGRSCAAYGGVYVAASLRWLWAVEGFRPDRWDLEPMGHFEQGSTIIVFAPRGCTLVDGVAPGARIRVGRPLVRLASR